MILTFPRKFAKGRKVDIADVYGELHIWPGGHFHYMISIRNTAPGEHCRVNVSFAVFDANQALLGTYGMLPEEEMAISPLGRINHDLYGKIAEGKLARAASVALAFRLAGQGMDVEQLVETAGIGNELVLCAAAD